MTQKQRDKLHARLTLLTTRTRTARLRLQERSDALPQLLRALESLVSCMEQGVGKTSP